VEASLKIKGESISSAKLSIGYAKLLKRKAEELCEEYVRKTLVYYVKKGWIAGIFLISCLLSAYALAAQCSLHTNQAIIKCSFNPMEAATVAMTWATLLMVHISRKEFEAMHIEMRRRLAEEALDFLEKFRKSINLRDMVERDDPVNIVPEVVSLRKLYPKTHLLPIVYGEKPALLRKLSSFLKALLAYSVSINPEDSCRLKTSIEDLLKCIDSLEARLCEKYGVQPPSHPRSPQLRS